MRLVGKLIFGLALLFPDTTWAQFESKTVTAANQTITINSQNRPVIGVAVTANTNVTMTPQATVDGTNWATIQACAISTGTCVTSITSTGSWTIGSAGQSQIRLLVASVGATPTATIAMLAATAGGGGGGGSGGGGGAVTIADGADVTQGSLADAATCVTTNTVIACLRQIDADIKGSVAAGTNRIGYTSDDPCSQLTKINAPISFQTTALTQQIAASGSNKVYICGMSFIASAATVFSVVGGTGSNCASNQLAILGTVAAAHGLSLAANGGLTFGSGNGTVAVTAASSEICLVQSGSGDLSGNISYVYAP